MAFYIKKSLQFGSIRFNLSKSGIGVSAGTKGFRVGSGPKGNYVHMGQEGFHYRTTLPSGKVRIKDNTNQSQNNNNHIFSPPAESQLNDIDIYFKNRAVFAGY